MSHRELRNHLLKDGNILSLSLAALPLAILPSLIIATLTYGRSTQS